MVSTGGRFRVLLFNDPFSKDAENVPASPARPDAPTSTYRNL